MDHNESLEFELAFALSRIDLEKEGKDFHEGVQTRMEWTIDRLQERVLGHYGNF